jgi:hypothetical protein
MVNTSGVEFFLKDLRPNSSIMHCMGSGACAILAFLYKTLDTDVIFMKTE